MAAQLNFTEELNEFLASTAFVNLMISRLQTLTRTEKVKFYKDFENQYNSFRNQMSNLRTLPKGSKNEAIKNMFDTYGDLLYTVHLIYLELGSAEVYNLSTNDDDFMIYDPRRDKWFLAITSEPRLREYMANLSKTNLKDYTREFTGLGPEAYKGVSRQRAREYAQRLSSPRTANQSNSIPQEEKETKDTQQDSTGNDQRVFDENQPSTSGTRKRTNSETLVTPKRRRSITPPEEELEPIYIQQVRIPDLSQNTNFTELFNIIKTTDIANTIQEALQDLNESRSLEATRTLLSDLFTTIFTQQTKISDAVEVLEGKVDDLIDFVNTPQEPQHPSLRMMEWLIPQQPQTVDPSFMYFDDIRLNALQPEEKIARLKEYLRDAVYTNRVLQEKLSYKNIACKKLLKDEEPFKVDPKFVRIANNQIKQRISPAVKSSYLDLYAAYEYIVKVANTMIATKKEASAQLLHSVMQCRASRNADQKVCNSMFEILDNIVRTDGRVYDKLDLTNPTSYAKSLIEAAQKIIKKWMAENAFQLTLSDLLISKNTLVSCEKDIKTLTNRVETLQRIIEHNKAQEKHLKSFK